MGSCINASKENNEENEIAKPNPIMTNLKSDYFLRKLYDIISKKKKLEIIRFNKKMQNRINLSIKDYKEYSEIFTPIEIEIVPTKGKYGNFIKINKNDKLFYHIYFNDNKKEIKNKYYIKEEDKVRKIKIIIDYQVKSFKYLFEWCEYIEFINFKKFYRNNITDMSLMFDGCLSLKELNLNNFKTNNVTNMSFMFSFCSSLKELNINNFNTNNVIDMSYMFFNCSSLNELNLINFYTNNKTDLYSMFSGCSNELVMKIKTQFKNIKEEAFKN